MAVEGLASSISAAANPANALCHRMVSRFQVGGLVVKAASGTSKCIFGVLLAFLHGSP